MKYSPELATTAEHFAGKNLLLDVLDHDRVFVLGQDLLGAPRAVDLEEKAGSCEYFYSHTHTHTHAYTHAHTRTHTHSHLLAVQHKV